MHLRLSPNNSHDPEDGAVVLGPDPRVYGWSSLECAPFVEAAYNMFNSAMPEEYHIELLKHWKSIFGMGWKPIDSTDLFAWH
eukprot:5426295-Ditylum_brightwellii.AAC.1